MFYISCDDEGNLTEIVAANISYLHLERMSAEHWWMVIRIDGADYYVNFNSIENTIEVRVEEDG